MFSTAFYPKRRQHPKNKFNMKLVLIMFVAIAAVAIGASVDRRRRDSGADFDAAEATAGGRGFDVRAGSAVMERKDEQISESGASARYGTVHTKNVIKSAKLRKSGEDDKARAQRAA